MAKEMPVVVRLCSVSQARSSSAETAPYRVEGLDVRVPDIVGELCQTRKDAGKARPPRLRPLGQWHGGRRTGLRLSKLAACSSPSSAGARRLM